MGNPSPSPVHPKHPPRRFLNQIAADPRRVMSHPREWGAGAAGERAASDAMPLGWAPNMHVNTRPAMRVPAPSERRRSSLTPALLSGVPQVWIVFFFFRRRTSKRPDYYAVNDRSAFHHFASVPPFSQRRIDLQNYKRPRRSLIALSFSPDSRPWQIDSRGHFPSFSPSRAPAVLLHSPTGACQWQDSVFIFSVGAKKKKKKKKEICLHLAEPLLLCRL